MVEDTKCLPNAKAEGDPRAARAKAALFSVTSVGNLYLATRLRKCFVECHWWTHGYTKNSDRRAPTCPLKPL